MKVLTIEPIEDGQYYLSGVMLRDTVPDFWQRRAQWLPKESAVILDLSRLERVDSAGVAMLLHLKHHLNLHQQTLTLKNIPTKMGVLLALSHISDQFSEHPSPDGE